MIYELYPNPNSRVYSIFEKHNIIKKIIHVRYIYVININIKLILRLRLICVIDNGIVL